MLNTKAETLYNMLDQEIDKQLDYRIKNVDYDVRRMIDNQITQMITERVRDHTSKLFFYNEIDTLVKKEVADQLLKIELSPEDLKEIRAAISRNFKDSLVRAAKDKLQEKVSTVINAYEHNILTVGRNRATLENLLNGEKSN